MSHALHIGINALYLIPGAVGGTEIYLRNLLSALARLHSPHSFTLFTNLETGDALVPSHAVNFRALVQPVHANNRAARLLWEQFALPRALRRAGVDVLLNPGFTAPFFSPCPSVTVFHDLQHKRHPEHFRWFDLPFWRFFLYWSARRSHSLIAVSSATRDDLVHFYHLDPRSIAVVPHGVEDAFFEIGRSRATPSLEPYFLCVSTLHPHKNLERLVRCFASFHKHHPDFRLVLAGLHGFHTEALQSLIQELGIQSAIEITGWIPREDLYRLFRHAWAFFYPSTFEGFGMPVIEALAAGIPTGCSSIDPIRGIAADAALQFDPHDDAALARAMERLAGDDELRSYLAAAGPRRAQSFRWETAANETLRALEAAAS